AFPDRDVLRAVDVDAVGARAADAGLGGARNRDADVLDHDAVAAVEVKIPETRILQRDALDAHVVAAVDEHEPRPLDLEIGATRVFLPPLPERLPEFHAIAIDAALAADAHAVDLLGVDERHAPRLEVTLDARLALRVVLDVVRTEEHRALVEPERDRAFQKNRAAGK